MAKALILSADRWEMTDEKTNKPLSGVSVWFVNDYREDTPEACGFKPTKVSAQPEVYQAIRAAGVTLPAQFEMSWDSKPGAQGKAALVLAGAKHLKNVDLFAGK